MLTPWPYGKPTTVKYEFLNSRVKGKTNKVLRLREPQDNATVEDVVFHPYTLQSYEEEEDLEPIDFSPIAAYNGPLFYPGGYTMYNP